MLPMPKEIKFQLENDRLAMRQKLRDLLTSPIDPKELDMYVRMFNFLGYKWELTDSSNGTPMYKVEYARGFRTVGYCYDLVTVVTFCQQYELRQW